MFIKPKVHALSKAAKLTYFWCEISTCSHKRLQKWTTCYNCQVWLDPNTLLRPYYVVLTQHVLHCLLIPIACCFDRQKQNHRSGSICFLTPLFTLLCFLISLKVLRFRITLGKLSLTLTSDNFKDFPSTSDLQVKTNLFQNSYYVLNRRVKLPFF